MSKLVTNCARFAVACSNERKTEYPAKESHLEDVIFAGQENQNNQLVFN